MAKVTGPSHEVSSSASILNWIQFFDVKIRSSVCTQRDLSVCRNYQLSVSACILN